MEITIEPTLENMLKHFGRYDYEVAYPIECIEKYFDKEDIFYLKKKDKKAIVVKSDAILISAAETVTTDKKEELIYGIDKLYFKDIKKVNLKEFGEFSEVLGGHLQLTITIDGYEDIILNSKNDAFKSANGQEVLEADLRKVISKIFGKIK